LPDLPGQRQAAKEVRQMVGQGKQLQPRLVVVELAAGELRPFTVKLIRTYLFSVMMEIDHVNTHLNTTS